MKTKRNAALESVRLMLDTKSILWLAAVRLAWFQAEKNRIGRMAPDSSCAAALAERLEVWREVASHQLQDASHEQRRAFGNTVRSALNSLRAGRKERAA